MQIYNLIPILQIAQVLLGDAIISSRTDSHNDSKMEKTKYGKIKNKSCHLLEFFILTKQYSMNLLEVEI